LAHVLQEVVVVDHALESVCALAVTRIFREGCCRVQPEPRSLNALAIALADPGLEAETVLVLAVVVMGPGVPHRKRALELDVRGELHIVGQFLEALLEMYLPLARNVIRDRKEEQG
jgi:hypothetical protein